MSERIKLGLSRNRLFEFDNCVCFLGETEEEFDIVECEKTLKTLCLKEPLLRCGIELCENGEAYLVTEQNEICLEVFQGDIEEFVQNKKCNGFDFTKELFSFAILNRRAIGIFAHTVVADARSLMYLAGEFMRLYISKALSVTPSEMKVFSETSQMPSNVFSVVIDRLASDLEVGWQKKTAVFTSVDYKKAREKYLKTKSLSEKISAEIPEELLTQLKNFAQRENTDVSSLVAFAFYESLTELLGGRRRYRKFNIQANERLFFEDCGKMQVGAFNGFVTVEKKKDKKAPGTLKDNAVAFHKEIYKRVTSAFKVFYNEFLFMRLPPSFVDSQYMFCVGEFEHKYSKKLANTYGCNNEVVGEFCSFNLNQVFWSELNAFKNIVPCEPLKMRSSTLITFVEKGERGSVSFEYRKDRLSDSEAQLVMEKTVDLLNKFN